MNNKSDELNNIDIIKEKYDEYSKLLYTKEIEKYVNKKSKYNKEYKDKESICKLIMWLSSYSFIFTLLGITIFKNERWYLFIGLLLSVIVPIFYNFIFEFFWNLFTKSRQDEEEKEKNHLTAEYQEKIYKQYEPYINQFEEYKKKRLESINIKTNTKYRICPWCEGRLVRKKGRYGYFVGCNNFPRCRYTRNK